VSKRKKCGALLFSLIFLLLFLSRKKVNKERLNLNIATAKKILFRLSSFLLSAYILPFFACAKKGTKESTADFDAVAVLG